MIRKLLMTAAVAVIALIPSIRIGIAEAAGGGLHGGVIHTGVIHGRVAHGRVAHDRIIHGGINGRPGFRGNGFGYGGLVGYADPDATTEGSSAPTITQQPLSVVPAVDLPPCRETTAEGVVVARGTACSRGAR